MQAQYKQEGSYTPDNVVASMEEDTVKIKVTLASGQNLKRGAVLGKITASGKQILSASAAADGSQNVESILAMDCDASTGDKEVIVYVAGTFNKAALIFGAGHSATSTFDALRDKGIYLV